MTGAMRITSTRNGGFTLIEMLIVLVIIAVLLGIATISFSTWVQKYEIERQVYILYAELMKSRGRSIATKRIHFVNLGESNYSVVADTHPAPFGDGEQSPADDIVQPETVLVKKINAASTVSFDTRGLAPLNRCRTICIYSNVSPDFDCIVISRARIQMGKIKNQGDDCHYENCMIK